MTDAVKFWDKIAPKYAQDPIKDLAAYEYTRGRTQSYLTEDSYVLEIGCGTGSTAIELSHAARQIVAADISPAMIGIAKTKAETAGISNVDFRAMSAEDAAKLTEPFDVVMGFNIFHLARNADDIFGDIYRNLPSGGYFISKTPCLADPSLGMKRFIFKPMIGLLQMIGKAPAVRSFTHAELEAAITFAGFEIVESGNFPAMSRYIVARKK